MVRSLNRVRALAPGLFVTALGLAALLVFVGAAPARLAADTTSPVLQQPPDQTITATSGCAQTFCGTLNYTFDVSDPDNTPDQITVTCNTANGWTFFWGMSMLTCQAHDPAGNKSAPVMFKLTVMVPPPTFQNVPGPVTFPATGPAGAVATFVPPTAVDVGGQADPVTCDHQSGITYPIGTTTVTCTATIQRNDSNGLPIGGLPSATTRFAITITPASSGGAGGGGGGGTPAAQDTTAPTIAQRPNIAVDATSRTGAVVRFIISATDPDNDASQITVGCSPASGTTFPLAAGARTRRTTVNCQAHDAADNNASPTSFTVTVLGFHDQIGALELLVNTSNVVPARKVALITRLMAADHAFRTQRTSASAQANLRAFIAQVRRLPSSPTRKAIWIAAATRAIAITN
jgi:hypothetical protein